MLAFAVQWEFWFIFQPLVWFLFYPAVFFSALIGGFIPGIIATVFSALIVWWFFIPPQFSFSLNSPMEFVSIIMFCVMGGLFSITLGRLKTVIQLAAETNNKLRLSEKHYRLLVDGVKDVANIMLDASGRVISWNEAAQRLKGYTSEEIIGQHFSIFYPSDQDVFEKTEAELVAAQEQGCIEDEGWRLRRDGSRFLAHVMITPLYGDQGELLGFSKISHDITERKNAEEALRQLSERLSLATRAGGVGIWDYDVVHNTLSWDDQMFVLYGVSREQFSGAYEAWRSGLFPDDAARGDLEIQMALSGEKDFNTEFRVLKPDGTIRHIRAMGNVQRDGQGQPQRMVGTNWDITEQVQSRTALLDAKQKAEEALMLQRRLQDELVQSEKLAALGELVAGVAHEINTPVGITLSAATHLSSETKKTDALYQAGELTEEGLAEYFSTAQQASQLITINSRRAADLIHSFKQIAVDQAGGEMRNFDLADYLNEILLSVGPKLRKRNVAVKTDCPAGILLHGLPGVLAQVLTNLIMNSLLHGYNEDQHGQIEIAVHDTGDHIELVYHDDGKGIPLEFHHKIFDPFFTTARGKGGSGMGLHIVYNIVTQMLHGSIEMQSSPGKGCTFILHFPRILAD
ncbi:MAG: hypothetical protein A2522_07430 [Gallionellales bacterium RIFOXYD12_FULL_53_10]|jgi:PAS domain S-box-containing protein|nr:MAG: hypothetical protein A2Z87_05610 [Gallionellales bacterium GWA2_54_124]OGT18228.1 MAG: hypothetical protein A2522_07430 [Gallionellales bacterium RIFOXYD12_FULL_53_10]